MTPEQIEDLREMQAAVPPGVEVGTWRLDPDTFDALLAAAERALALEDVLAAAKEVREDGALCDKARNCDYCDALRAAIDRAEGKP